METWQQYHDTAAVTLARVFLGLLFVFQGYDVIFKVGIKRAITTYQNGFEEKGIPTSLVSAGVWFTSLTEFLCGVMLVLGLFTYPALYLLGLNLLVASIGFAIDTPLWNMRHVFPRLILLLFLLIVPPGTNLFSIDHLIF